MFDFSPHYFKDMSIKLGFRLIILDRSYSFSTTRHPSSVERIAILIQFSGNIVSTSSPLDKAYIAAVEVILIPKIEHLFEPIDSIKIKMINGGIRFVAILVNNSKCGLVTVSFTPSSSQTALISCLPTPMLP